MKSSFGKSLVLWLVVIMLALAGFFWWQQKGELAANSPEVEKSDFIGEGQTRLVYAVHWMEDLQINGIYDDKVLKSKGLRQYLEDYVKIHPEISFELRQIPYGEYADKLIVLHQADMMPDIYQIYSQWGVTYASLDMLDTPPADVLEDVKKNYLSTKGATINGKIWGIPTEINDYALLYNKEIFAEAGVTAPPKTWSEFAELAVRLTQNDKEGNFTRYGTAFLKGNDWQVVDPFLSLVFSNGGSFLSRDNKSSMLNRAEAIGALESQVELFEKGATSIDANFFDFGKGKVAMVISPPWVKSGFKDEKTGFGKRFDEVVGVAPFPYMKKPASLEFAWFMGVTNKSQNKKAAWDFLRWFTSDVSPTTNTTRYGDLLANTIGAIPSRKTDTENQAALKDAFTSTFVEQLPMGVAEPNVLQSNKIKTVLMGEIEAAWARTKTSKQALEDASVKINELLKLAQ